MREFITWQIFDPKKEDNFYCKTLGTAIRMIETEQSNESEEES